MSTTSNFSPKDPWASQSGHWYLKDGTPAYEVPNKSKKVKCPECTGALRSAADKERTAACLVCDEGGYTYPEMRGTTLRDARVIDAGSSPTSLLRLLAQPGLDIWKRDQLKHAIYTAPKTELEGLAYEAWDEKVETWAQEYTRLAVQGGVDIHATLERGFRGESLEGYIYAPWYEAVVAKCIETFGRLYEFEAERSYACDFGFGAKIDLIYRPEPVVIDFKTKKMAEGEEPELEIEHCIQLAANAVAAGCRGARGFIFFVDRESPCCVVREATTDQMRTGWHIFQHLLALHRLMTGYKPTWALAPLEFGA